MKKALFAFVTGTQTEGDNTSCALFCDNRIFDRKNQSELDEGENIFYNKI